MANGIYFKREELFETLKSQDQKYDSNIPVKDVRYNY
jgi:hypothetical protein